MIENFKIYLIRHAPVEKFEDCVPENNPNAIINLNHFKTLSSNIPHNSICYVSPLKRALQTAKALSKFVKFRELIIEDKLKEQNFGKWSGKKISLVWNELMKFKPRHNFSFISAEVCPPGGDTFLEQCKRVTEFIEYLYVNNQSELVIITHSGTIRAFLTYVLDIDPNIAISTEISCLSLTTLEILKKENHKNKGGRFRLINVNHQVI